jgi:UDP-N-acetylmuramate: L-alanyl-gamma-D-glutamyl-meso-diaminopimelate ligase
LAAGNFFVSEGDEYETAFFDRSAKFFKYRPDILLITALEHDHLDFYRTPEAYLKSFQNLVNQVPGRGLIIVNHDDAMARQAVSKAFAPVISYGQAGADYVICRGAANSGTYRFRLQNNSRHWQFQTSLAGSYNIWNLAAGIILALKLRLPLVVIKKALATFQGVERRLTVIGRIKNTVFIEDFAHHPTAIGKVLQAPAELYPGNRIVAIFEPRSWSLRRNFFQDELPAALAHADEIIIKDVFEKEKIPAAERLDVARIKKELEAAGRGVRIFADFSGIQQFLAGLDFSQKRVIILLSNGDVHNFTDWVKDLTRGDVSSSRLTGK